MNYKRKYICEYLISHFLIPSQVLLFAMCKRFMHFIRMPRISTNLQTVTFKLPILVVCLFLISYKVFYRIFRKLKKIKNVRVKYLLKYTEICNGYCVYSMGYEYINKITFNISERLQFQAICHVKIRCTCMSKRWRYHFSCWHVPTLRRENCWCW